MKKRQIKKQNKIRLSRFKEKVKAVVTVDLTDATAGSQIDIYISDKFETKELVNGDSWIKNEKQDRYISYKKIESKGFTHAVWIKNGVGKHFGICIWLTDIEKSYYIIRTKEEVAV